MAPADSELRKIADAYKSFIGTVRADVDRLNIGEPYMDRCLGLWLEQDLGDPARPASERWQARQNAPRIPRGPRSLHCGLASFRRTPTLGFGCGLGN